MPSQSPGRLAVGRVGCSYARWYRSAGYTRAVPVQRPHIELYTDGACSGNPGPGGWAYLLRHPESGKVVENAGGSSRTTNNRMELRAVIEGLAWIKEPAVVDVYSDSKYVLGGLDEWMDGWIRKGWRNSAKKAVKNADLWKRLDELRKTHDLRYHWVKGHSEHAENDRCDALAVAARDRAAMGEEGGPDLDGPPEGGLW